MSKHLKEENKKFGSEFVEIETPPHPNATFVKCMRNNKFLVQIFQEPHTIRLSVSRTQLAKNGKRWEDGITWDELQAVKDGCGFEDMCGLEVYPPKKHIVNNANMRHLFLVNGKPIFMWKNKP